MILKESRWGVKRDGSLGKKESGYLSGYMDFQKCNSDYRAQSIKAGKWLLEEEQGVKGHVHSRRDSRSCDFHMKTYGPSSHVGLPPDKSQGHVVHFRVAIHCSSHSACSQGAQVPPPRASSSSIPESFFPASSLLTKMQPVTKSCHFDFESPSTSPFCCCWFI